MTDKRPNPRPLDLRLARQPLRGHHYGDSHYGDRIRIPLRGQDTHCVISLVGEVFLSVAWPRIVAIGRCRWDRNPADPPRRRRLRRERELPARSAKSRTRQMLCECRKSRYPLPWSGEAPAHGCAVLMFPPCAAAAARPELDNAQPSVAPKVDLSVTKHGVRVPR